jgi:type III restriction enzyme
LAIVVDGQEQPIGDDSARLILDALIDQGMLESDGRISRSFDPRAKDFSLSLPDELSQLRPAVVDLLSSYRIEKHIRRERDEGMNRLKKEVALGPEFRALWERIKAKTTYRVEFDTETLVTRASRAVATMQRIEAPVVRVTAGKVEIKRAGILASAFMASQESVDLSARALPDILAYLQEQTELTRSTLVRILRESGRLAEFFVDPQRFMDAVAAILRYELHQLLIDGIKYERIQGAGGEAEWEMLLFKDEELIDYLNAERVTKSVYEYVVYESEVEREFAAQLDAREDIKLFVKLPRWFTVDTPIGTYNPDWAIVRQDHTIMYLVRETKSTKDFLKLRTSEADKVRCGLRHFETLGVSFGVVTSAEEV